MFYGGSTLLSYTVNTSLLYRFPFRAGGQDVQPRTYGHGFDHNARTAVVFYAACRCCLSAAVIKLNNRFMHFFFSSPQHLAAPQPCWYQEHVLQPSLPCQSVYCFPSLVEIVWVFVCLRFCVFACSNNGCWSARTVRQQAGFVQTPLRGLDRFSLPLLPSSLSSRCFFFLGRMRSDAVSGWRKNVGGTQMVSAGQSSPLSTKAHRPPFACLDLPLPR